MVAHAHHEDTPKAPKAPTVAERAQVLLDELKHCAEHNGPVSPHVVEELTAIVESLAGHKTHETKHA